MKRNEVMADDLNNMLSDMINVVIKRVPLSEIEQDALWEKLQIPLEIFFNYPDYRNYN
jgi:hypothetical protein